MRLSFRAIPTVICLAASLIPAAAQDGQGQNGQGQRAHGRISLKDVPNFSLGGRRNTCTQVFLSRTLYTLGWRLALFFFGG